MIYASVAKLNQYKGYPAFDAIMHEIEAAQYEGLPEFELDLSGIEYEMKLDILCALENVGYAVNNTEEETYYKVSYE